jgi:hypothetical protein
MTNDVSFLSVGDISFRGRMENTPSSTVFQKLAQSFAPFDHIVANLESPLVHQNEQAVPGKCTLRGDIGWADVLKNAGINLVSIANNHMMDYGTQGLLSTIEALNKAGILYVGAGRNASKARAPAFIKIADKKIGFLARSTVEVSSPCYADQNKPGVALFEKTELLSAVSKCRESADLVVVMLHWGIEHYHYPTPEQRYLAKKIVSAGANILLGHHPHVLQGEETINGTLVSYSSGNFLFDEFPWYMTFENGITREFYSGLSEENRQGIILQINQKDDGPITSKQIFTFINGDGTISLDPDSKRNDDYLTYCKRLQIPFYDFLWKIYSAKREWDLRLKKMLSPRIFLSKLHKLRPRHFMELIKHFRRSSRIFSGKSTNPYD